MFLDLGVLYVIDGEGAETIFRVFKDPDSASLDAIDFFCGFFKGWGIWSAI